MASETEQREWRKINQQHSGHSNPKDAPPVKPKLPQSEQEKIKEVLRKARGYY